MIVLYLFIAFSLIDVIFSTNNSPIVKVHLGTIKGYYKESYEGKKYEAYEGIPYAKPPVGNRRFQVFLIIDDYFHKNIFYVLDLYILKILLRLRVRCKITHESLRVDSMTMRYSCD